MSFAHPWWLILLALVPVLAWFRGRLGPEPALLFSSTRFVRRMGYFPKSNRGRMMAAMRWLALALLVIALARPRGEEGETRIQASGIDIVLAFDLSTSMLAEDFVLEDRPASRFEIAKVVLKDFVEARPHDRIGLVAFAGNAYIASPLTLDHDFLQSNLERLEIGQIEDGTAIGSALAAASMRLKDLPSKSRIAILMTDGQNTAGKVPPLTAAEAAAVLKIKVYTIGVGTQGYANYPYTDDFGRKRYQKMQVDIDEETLKGISEKTGGRYYRADDTDSLRKIYGEIDQLEKSDIEIRSFQRYEEWYAWFLYPGLAIFLTEQVLRRTTWRKLP